MRFVSTYPPRRNFIDCGALLETGGERAAPLALPIKLKRDQSEVSNHRLSGEYRLRAASQTKKLGA
jgi:hypothetical protein